MSAVFKAVAARFEPLSEARLDAVLAIEQTAYAQPWSRGNFADSLRAGYQAQLLLADDAILGYFIAMKGVDEVHLLNITVAPAWQGQGWGRVLLDALAIWSRGHWAMPWATCSMARRGEGGSWGHQKCSPGWCWATCCAMRRALADWGEERKPCR